MARLRRFVFRLVTFFRFHRSEDELTRELESHLALMEDEFLHKGLTAVEARLAARRAFGGVEQTKDRYRDARGLPAVDGVWRDIRIAARTSLRHPGFSLAVIAILTLGIAASVAMFTVLDQVVLQPLPYPRADRLVRVQSPVPGIRPDAVWNLSTAEYFYF